MKRQCKNCNKGFFIKEDADAEYCPRCKATIEKYDIKMLEGHEKCSICGNKELWVSEVIDIKGERYKYLCIDCYINIINERNVYAERTKELAKESANAWKKKVINLPLEI